MKGKSFKKALAVILVLSFVVGMLPISAIASGGTAGESAENPILISTMDQLIEEMEKDVTTPTYYKLTDDVSHETGIKYSLGSEWKTDFDGYDTVRKYADSKLVMAQCVVGTGKKFLELDGHDIHYKNNVNFNHSDNSRRDGSGPQYDSLTFFYLGEGCDLTVSSSSRDNGEVWYDGWMHNRTNFIDGPNYIYTAVRDVFRVDAGAELTVNNTDIKAGRNRKIWMVNSFYVDKDDETNVIIKLTWNGFAYEQIYGSAIVANGGKVTVNGGYIEGRGSSRDKFNITGVPEWRKDDISNMYYNFTIPYMLENCLSNVGAKAAVQIAGEGSTVIINDGEFWGCGGANVIGINTLNGGSVKEYTLRINAGTFDTSKTDKERIPDRNAGSVNDGPWALFAKNAWLWADCRCIRDTLRGNIGIPAVDGYGKNVFNTKMAHVYIDDEEPEDECIDNADLDFRYKSDSDTIIVKPRTEKSYWSTETPIWENYAGRSNYCIYAYSYGEIAALGSGTLYHGPNESTTLFFSAVSNYDMTDEDNPYLKKAHLATCKWILYEEDKNGNLINSYERSSASFKAEHKDGHTVYNFKIPLNYFPLYSGVKWDDTHKYYIVAYMEERFQSSVHTYVANSYIREVFRDVKDGVLDGILEYDYRFGLEIDYDTDYSGSFATSGAEVIYSNAVYDSVPVLTFNDEFKKLEGSMLYQWQVLEGDEWVDYGNTRISPEAAAEILLYHRGLTGKQVRMKITSYDGIYKDALYSNVCTVQKDQNTRWPDLGNFSWKADPNHSGKYILNTNTFNEWLELLIYPYDSERDLSTLDWSKAVSPSEDGPVVFNNLGVGVYTVYARFKETEDYVTGTEIGYSKVVVGPYTALTGTNVLYDGKPVTEIFVKQYETLKLTVAPVPDNATLNSANVTRWIPDEEKTNILVLNNSALEDFSEPVLGSSINLIAAELGYCTIRAVTKLSDGTNSIETITIRVVPDNYIPYTLSVANRGAEVYEGSSFVPQVALHARVEMLTKRRATKFEVEDLADSDIKTKLQSDTIKKQLRDRLTWALVDPIPEFGRPPYTDSTNKASINTKTGEITLKDAAVAGNVIAFVGILNDPYLGQIVIPGTFTVVAAPEPEPHICDYEGYSVIAGDMSSHYRVCECGKKKTEFHKFTEFSSENGGQTVKKYVCSCGFTYSKTVSTYVELHVHDLETVYDNDDHWQICADENCPEEYSTAHQKHTFETVKDDSGKESKVCKECGMYLNEVEAGPSLMLGDVNKNGKVEKYDYILVKRAVMGTVSLDDEQKQAADVNVKGGVEKYDYILIKRHVMGTFTIG